MVSLFPEREIFLQAGGVSIRWYGLLWAASFWLVWYFAPKLQKYRELTLSQDEWTKIIAWGAVGALIGGRLGYVLFYEPAFFFQNPVQIFTIWQGGMASHGGFIGVGLAVWLLLHKQKNILAVLDVLTIPIALALTLGRLGNWINLEIFGSNPIAIGKNLLVAGVCYLILRSTWKRVPLETENEGGGHAAEGASGSVLVVFLVLYSILRFLIEPLRDDPWALTFGLTRGQLLTLPLLALGVWLGGWLLRRQRHLRRPTGT